MRAGIVMVAMMASMLFTPAVQAASDPDSAELLNSTSDRTKFKALQQEFNSGPEFTKA